MEGEVQEELLGLIHLTTLLVLHLQLLGQHLLQPLVLLVADTVEHIFVPHQQVVLEEAVVRLQEALGRRLDRLGIHQPFPALLCKDMQVETELATAEGQVVLAAVVVAQVAQAVMDRQERLALADSLFKAHLMLRHLAVLAQVDRLLLVTLPEVVGVAAERLEVRLQVAAVLVLLQLILALLEAQILAEAVVELPQH